MRRIRKTAKFSLLGCLALVLHGIATSSGAGWLYVISASLAAVLAVSALSTLTNTRRIEAKRHSPPVGIAGEPISCALEVRNTGRLPKALLEIEDHFAGGTGYAVAAQVKPGESERLNYVVENPRRGVYSEGEAKVESAAPFGLLAARRILRAPSATTIYPKTFEVAGLWRPESSDAAEPGRDEAAAPRRGAGGDFWGVREYRPGDPARLIAWRQSARAIPAGKLAVMEMARETDPPFTVILDLDAEAPYEAREMAVSAAASLLLRALREGREIIADAGPQRVPFPENPDADATLGWCAALGSAGSRKTTTRGWRFRESLLSRLMSSDPPPQSRESGGGEGGDSKPSPPKHPVEPGEGSSGGEAEEFGKSRSRTLRLPKRTERVPPHSPLPVFPSPELPPELRGSSGLKKADIEIAPSLRRLRAGECRADTVVLVSCHEFAGPGAWMSPEEERRFMDEVEAAGRRAARVGRDAPSGFALGRIASGGTVREPPVRSREGRGAGIHSTEASGGEAGIPEGEGVESNPTPDSRSERQRAAHDPRFSERGGRPDRGP